jgi:hypothetical protein
MIQCASKKVNQLDIYDTITDLLVSSLDFQITYLKEKSLMTTSDRMRHRFVSFPKGSMSLQGMEEEEEDDELRSTSKTSSKSYKPLTEDDLSFRELSTANTRPASTDTAALAALVDHRPPGL